MENIIQFAFNIFNLGIFWFYLKSFKGMKNIPGIIKNVIIVARNAETDLIKCAL